MRRAGATRTAAALLALAIAGGHAVADDADLGPDPQRWFLYGNVEEARERALTSASSDPFLAYFLDHAWRRPPADGVAPSMGPPGPLVGERVAWIASGGSGPWPVAEGQDPHPVLTALVQDRRDRERRGLDPPGGRSPMDALAAHPRYGEDAAWFRDRVVTPAYRGPEVVEDAAARVTFEGARGRSLALAVLGPLALLALAILAARRLRPGPRAPNAT